MSAKISIIVPIYNVERFLSKCIESILNQNFKDFQLLLINDGSTDSSGEICNRYAQIDNRIQVFHKTNGGVSSARNLGLDNAVGEWISFIDADDYISPDFFDFDYNNKCDVIEKGYTIICNDNDQVKNTIKDLTYTNKKDFSRYYVNKGINALWNKIIRRNVIGDRKFNVDIKIGEDLLFFLSCWENINSYSLVSKGAYYYIIRENSAWNNVTKSRHKEIESIFQIFKYSICQKTGQYNNLIYSYIYKRYIYTLYKLRKFLSIEEKQKLYFLISNISRKNLTYLNHQSYLKLLFLRIIVTLRK